MMRSPEKYRTHGDASWGPNGAYRIPAGVRRPLALKVIASDGSDWHKTGMPFPAWEHVSVSTATRCPTWEEMCLVKDLFWEPEDVAVQYHPAKSEYINCHPFVLHMWRPADAPLLCPPSFAVGPSAEQRALIESESARWAEFLDECRVRR